MKQGCRSGEARALRWENVDFKAGVVVICAAMDTEVYRPRTKEGDIRYLPLHPEVADALKKLPRQLSGFVFTYRGKPLHRKVVWETWAKAAKRAGVDINCYQGTKHSLGSQAVNSGVDLEILRRFFGHKDIRSTQRYVHV
jgi:integrase